MLNKENTIHEIQKPDGPSGFSIVEMLITVTITLIILGLAFQLLAGSLNKKSREETQASVLADANIGLSRMSQEITNAGFGLNTNGVVAGDSGQAAIRIRANLNALLRQTSSNTVTDQSEDVLFSLVANPTSGASLVRADIGTGRQSSILAGLIDNADVDSDGYGDGLTFAYLDAAGAAVTPANAVRVGITVRVSLPQVGFPGGDGFQPKMSKVLTSSVVLRNARRAAY